MSASAFDILAKEAGQLIVKCAILEARNQQLQEKWTNTANLLYEKEQVIKKLKAEQEANKQPKETENARGN